MVVLREVEKKLGILDKISNCVRNDSRNPATIRHSVRTLSAQRNFSLCLGLDDLNDHDFLRVQAIVADEVGENLASSPTLSRFERDVSRRSPTRLILLLSDIHTESYINSLPMISVLDSDAVRKSEEAAF